MDTYTHARTHARARTHTHTHTHTSSMQEMNNRSSVAIGKVLKHMNGSIKLQNEITNFPSIFRIIIEYCYQAAIYKFLLSLNCPIFGPCLDNIRLTFFENLMNGFDLFFYNLWSLYPYFCLRNHYSLLVRYFG